MDSGIKSGLHTQAAFMWVLGIWILHLQSFILWTISLHFLINKYYCAPTMYRWVFVNNQMEVKTDTLLSKFIQRQIVYTLKFLYFINVLFS